MLLESLKLLNLMLECIYIDKDIKPVIHENAEIQYNMLTIPLDTRLLTVWIKTGLRG